MRLGNEYARCLPSCGKRYGHGFRQLVGGRSIPQQVRFGGCHVSKTMLTFLSRARYERDLKFLEEEGTSHLLASDTS